MAKRKPSSELKKFRPLGAICLHCNYRPALPVKNHPHLATKFCSGQCKASYHWRRQEGRAKTEASLLRELFGLPVLRGPVLTILEMRTIRAFVEEWLVHPYRVRSTCDLCGRMLLYSGHGRPRTECPKGTGCRHPSLRRRRASGS